MRVKPAQSAPDAALLLRDAERCAERVLIPGAPVLKVIAGGDQSTFDMTFDGGSETIARALMNMDNLERALEKVRGG